MNTNEHALESLKWKKYKDMSNIEFCIIEYSKKNPALAEKAAADNLAMQARIEKLEIGLAGDYCPSCTWRGNVTLVHGVCPYCEVDWVELKIKENEEE